jgi:hypothetical protein
MTRAKWIRCDCGTEIPARESRYCSTLGQDVRVNVSNRSIESVYLGKGLMRPQSACFQEQKLASLVVECDVPIVLGKAFAPGFVCARRESSPTMAKVAGDCSELADSSHCAGIEKVIVVQNPARPSEETR